MRRYIQSKHQEEIETLTSLNNSFGENILDAEPLQLIEKARRFDSQHKQAILGLCVSSLNTEQSKENERSRVAIVRAMISLLPESLTIVKELLNKRSSKSNYETHFTDRKSTRLNSSH